MRKQLATAVGCAGAIALFALAAYVLLDLVEFGRPMSFAGRRSDGGVLFFR